MIIEQCKNIEELRSLAWDWMEDSHPEQFGLEVDLNVIKADLESWLAGEGAVLIAR